MVRFKQSFVDQLDEQFSSSRWTALIVIFAYVWGLLGVSLVLYGLHTYDLLVPDMPGVDTGVWFKHYLLNLCASYATVSIAFNAFLTLVMFIGGRNQMKSFVPLVTSGVTKIQYFHPHSILRNMVTRPLVASIMYTGIIVYDIVTFSPWAVSMVVTPKFILISIAMSLVVEVVRGFLITIYHKCRGASVLSTEGVIGTDVIDSATNTTIVPDLETPQEEYQPPKLETYFTIAV